MNDTVVTVTGAANAGVCLSFPDTSRIWIDFYPHEKTGAFTFLTDEEWGSAKQDPSLFPPDLVLFTHTHIDHFSAPRTKELLDSRPEIPIYIPAGSVWKTETVQGIPAPNLQELSGVHLIKGEKTVLSRKDVEIEMISTVHSSIRYADTPHYSFLFRFNNKQIFVSGDAGIGNEKLTEYLEEHRIDLAVMTFPWASTTKGTESIEYSVQPSHVLLNHIPREGDDPFHFRTAAINGASQLNVPDVRAILVPFQREVFSL